MDGDFLATYGTWDVEAFLRCHSAEEATLLLVIVRSPRPGDEARRDIGVTVRRVWDAITVRFPLAHGHRLSWGDVAFIVPGPPQGFAVEVAPISMPAADSECEVLASGTRFPTDPEGRRRVLDELAWRLAKVDYRREYPGEWCVRGGRIAYVAG